MGLTAVEPYVPEEAVQAIQQKRKVGVMAALRPSKAASVPPPMTSTPSTGNVTTPVPASTVPGGVLKAAANRLTLGSMNRSRSAPGKSRTTDAARASSDLPPGSGRAGEDEAAGASEAAMAALKPKDQLSLDVPGTVAPVAVDPSLPQITEALSDAGSDADQPSAPNDEETGTSRGQAPSSGESSTPSARAVPPRLSDAIMLERGRRVLARQGVDPNVTLRLAQPLSALTPSSPAPATSPVISVVPAASPSNVGPKGAFKLPTRRLSIPQRSYSTTPRSSTVGGSDSPMGRTTPASGTSDAASSNRPPQPVPSPTPPGGVAESLVESPKPQDDEDSSKRL